MTQTRQHHLDLTASIAHAIPNDYAHSRLLLAIAQYCRFDDGAWIAWPSIDTLRKACGYSDGRNIRLLLGQLKKLGLIDIFRRHRASNLYVLHIANIQEFDPVRSGLRKSRSSLTRTINQLLKAAKAWLRRKQSAHAGDVPLSHKDALAAARSAARAVEVAAKRAGRERAQAQHSSGPSRRALEMMSEVKELQLDGRLPAI